MAETKPIEIELDACGRGKILIDGQEIKHVRSITLQTEATQLTRVNLEILALDGIKYRGPAAVEMKHVCPMCNSALSPEAELADRRRPIDG